MPEEKISYLRIVLATQFDSSAGAKRSTGPVFGAQSESIEFRMCIISQKRQSERRNGESGTFSVVATRAHGEVK